MFRSFISHFYSLQAWRISIPSLLVLGSFASAACPDDPPPPDTSYSETLYFGLGPIGTLTSVRGNGLFLSVQHADTSYAYSTLPPAIGIVADFQQIGVYGDTGYDLIPTSACAADMDPEAPGPYNIVSPTFDKAILHQHHQTAGSSLLYLTYNNCTGLRAQAYSDFDGANYILFTGSYYLGTRWPNAVSNAPFSPVVGLNEARSQDFGTIHNPGPTGAAPRRDTTQITHYVQAITGNPIVAMDAATSVENAQYSRYDAQSGVNWNAQYIQNSYLVTAEVQTSPTTLNYICVYDLSYTNGQVDKNIAANCWVNGPRTTGAPAGAAPIGLTSIQVPAAVFGGSNTTTITHLATICGLNETITIVFIDSALKVHAVDYAPPKVLSFPPNPLTRKFGTFGSWNQSTNITTNNGIQLLNGVANVGGVRNMCVVHNGSAPTAQPTGPYAPIYYHDIYVSLWHNPGGYMSGTTSPGWVVHIQNTRPPSPTTTAVTLSNIGGGWIHHIPVMTAQQLTVTTLNPTTLTTAYGVYVSTPGIQSACTHGYTLDLLDAVGTTIQPFYNFYSQAKGGIRVIPGGLHQAHRGSLADPTGIAPKSFVWVSQMVYDAAAGQKQWFELIDGVTGSPLSGAGFPSLMRARVVNNYNITWSQIPIGLNVLGIPQILSYQHFPPPPQESMGDAMFASYTTGLSVNKEAYKAYLPNY